MLECYKIIAFQNKATQCDLTQLSFQTVPGNQTEQAALDSMLQKE